MVRATRNSVPVPYGRLASLRRASPRKCSRTHLRCGSSGEVMELTHLEARLPHEVLLLVLGRIRVLQVADEPGAQLVRRLFWQIAPTLTLLILVSLRTTMFVYAHVWITVMIWTVVYTRGERTALVRLVAGGNGRWLSSVHRAVVVAGTDRSQFRLLGDSLTLTHTGHKAGSSCGLDSILVT